MNVKLSKKQKTLLNKFSTTAFIASSEDLAKQHRDFMRLVNAQFVELGTIEKKCGWLMSARGQQFISGKVS